MIYSKPQDVMEVLIHAYYIERNIEKILSCVTDDIEWVGTENNNVAKGKTELKKMLEEDKKIFPQPISVAVETPQIKYIGSDVAIITLLGHQNEYYDEMGFSIRGTICCVKTEQGWLVSSGHTSVPNSEHEKVTLKNELEVERQKQKALLDNVPGGVAIYRVKKDGRISTDYISDGLARICGYENSEDIMTVMGYDSRKLVLSEDYPIVEKACRKSLEEGVPTSVTYRIKNKSGKPVRLTLDSVVMKNTQLGEEDVAVFYAVQTVVSEEANKKAEKQEMMESLLDTVPAGIGIFEINKTGITQSYMNNAFYKIISSSRKDRIQYTGDNLFSSTHPEDVKLLKQATNQLVNGKDTVQFYFRIKNGQGTWSWLHLTAMVVQRKENYVRVYVAFNECTENKRQQIQLLQNQKAVTLAEKRGKLSIWTYNIDKGIILQQTLVDSEGHLGYPAYIANVPNCFVETGSIYPEDIDKFLAVYEKLEAGEELADEIYRLKNNKNKEFNWVHMYYQRMENNDEGERMAVGFALEVGTQQKAIERYKVEQKLREQMYASAVSYLEYNLTKLEYTGKNNLAERYRTQNWECPNLEKYRENMGKNVDDAYLDEVVEKMYGGNLLKAFMNGETKVSCEYRSRVRPGMPSKWYKITAIMVKRPDTEDVMAFVYVEDIEDIKQRQLAMENSMADGIKNVIIIRLSDRMAKIIMSNGVRISGKNEKTFIYNDDFVRKSSQAVVLELKKDSYNATLLSTVISQLDEHGIYQYAISTKSENGELHRHLFSFRYLDDRETNIIMSISDITSVYLEEQEKKEQLENALDKLREASHAKSEFYSRMSHDMRTPMNGILGMAVLSEDENDSKKLKKNIEKIKSSGEYLLSLINDTLDIQRIESGKMKLNPEIVNITQVVENIIDMVNASAKAKGVNLKYSKGNTDLNWFIRVDALRLKQIFINLLSNAIKFTPAGGTVEFEFQLLKREGMISHDVVYVRDTGVGMSKEFLEKEIFKPFSQESNVVSTNYAGSGLGLSIAKSLVELMGGRIEVESKLGVGTSFAVYLDFERIEEAEAVVAIKSEKKQYKDVSEQLSEKKILLVEDHSLNAEITTKLLKKNRCEVTWAKNGLEAVSYFSKAAAYAYDAILMDIRMPIMDGLEATKQIRAMDKLDAKTIPIIAMTANAYEDDVQKGYDAGMNDYLTKPIYPKTFYETLARYVSIK